MPFARRGNIMGVVTFTDRAVPITVTTDRTKIIAYTTKKK
jgi:hypothetical protein